MALAFQLFFLQFTVAENQFKVSALGLQAIENIYVLKLEKAAALLQEDLKQNNASAHTYFLLHYVDYYTLISSQLYTDYQRLAPNQSKHLARVRTISRNSPYALYSEAEINLHWAVIKLMHKDYISGAFDLKSAYSAIQKNAELFPEFAPNRKTLGFLKAILGTLPENYDWILGIVGLRGNYKEGTALVEQYIQQYVPAVETKLDIQSANFYHTLLQFYYGDKMKSWKFCKTVTEDFATNPLHCYLRGFIAANTANNDEAIAILNKRPKSTEHASFYLIDYQMGMCKLHRLDADADIYFKKYVTFYKGLINLKEAYIKLSWIEWLNKDTAAYKVYRNMSLKYSSTQDDEEKQVAIENAKRIYPSREILKMRVLFDGGYYTQAEEVLKNIQPSQLPTLYQKAEYQYRAARLMQEQAKYAKAIVYFTEAIALTEKKSFEFAPMSALQLGYIYLKLRYPQTARLYFEKALSFKNYNDRGYVAQRARAELAKMP